MNKRVLGNGLEVSDIGFGCMGLTHAYGAAIERKEAVRLIREAAEAGYTFFDTAECYLGFYADGTAANNEEIVGEALKPVRDSVVIATKFGVTHGGNNLIMDSNPKTIRKSIEGSLKRLGVEVIDLYYQHRIDEKVPPEEVAGTMQELIKEGKILHWGISETDEDYLRRADAVCKVTAIQNRYSMMARWHENLFPVCEELNIGYVAFSPMANGFLSDAFGKGSKFAEGDFRNFMPQYSDEGYEANRELLTMIRNIAEEKNVTPAQVSLAWMLCKKPWIVPIPGTRRKERMIENAGAAEIVLTKAEVSEMDSLLDSIGMSEVFGEHPAKK